jgi:tRNA modification GTPase
VLVAHHLRDATTALDELVGAVDIEDILDRVFATFCVGK